MGNPLISVVVTTFNRPSLLTETVRSLLNQTYPHFEIVVVDNHSTTDVEKLLGTFRDDRIRCFKNENRGVIAVNRNVGIRKARGEMVAFCDDDDVWKPHKLSRQLDHFDADRHIGIGASFLSIKMGISARTRPFLRGTDRGLKELLTWGPVPFSSLMVTKTDALFSEDPRLRTVEDFDFQLRLVQRFKKTIAMVEEPLIYFRVHGANNNRNRADRMNGLRVLRPFKKIVSREVYRLALSRQYLLAGILSFKEGDRAARTFFKKAILFKPDGVQTSAALCVSRFPVPLWRWAVWTYYLATNALSFPFQRNGKSAVLRPKSMEGGRERPGLE